MDDKEKILQEEKERGKNDEWHLQASVAGLYTRFFLFAGLTLSIPLLVTQPFTKCDRLVNDVVDTNLKMIRLLNNRSLEAINYIDNLPDVYKRLESSECKLNNHQQELITKSTAGLFLALGRKF